MKKNSVVGGIIWSFGERIVAQIVSFIVSIILARILSPSDYGVVAIILIFINFFDGFVSSGFGSSLIQNKDVDNDDYTTIFYCSLIVSIIIYILLFISSPQISVFFNNQAITVFMRVLAIRIPISAFNTIQKAYISRNMMFQKFFFITLIGTSISAIIGIYMAYHGAGPWALIIQYLSNTVIDSITLFFIVEWKPKLVFKYNRAKLLMSYGWKILLAGMIGRLFDQLQSIIIVKFFSASDLAYYNKGGQIPSMISTNVENSVMTVLFPAIANKGDNQEAVRQMSRKAVRMMAFLVFPMTTGLAFVAHPLINILLTEKWENSIIYMQILCVSVAFNLIGNTGLQTIKAVGRSDLILKIEFYKKPVFILLLLCSIRFGVTAIAIATCLYSVYAMIINFGTMGRTIDYSVKEQFRDIWRVFRMSLGMIFLLIPLCFISYENDWIELAIKVTVGVFGYIVLSKILKSEEYTYIISFIKKRLKG